MIVPGFDPLFSLPNLSDVGGVGDVVTIVDYEFGLVTGVDRDTAAVSVRHVGNLAGSTFEFSARLRSTRSEARFALRVPPELVPWSDPADWPVGRPAGPFPAFAPVATYPAEDKRDVRVSGALFPVGIPRHSADRVDVGPRCLRVHRSGGPVGPMVLRSKRGGRDRIDPQPLRAVTCRIPEPRTPSACGFSDGSEASRSRLRGPGQAKSGAW